MKREFRPEERRSKTNTSPLDVIEFFLIEELEAATAPLSGTTECAVLVIRWMWDVSDLGDWDATANTPALADGDGNDGEIYTVSVAGTTTLEGLSSWSVGDVIQFQYGQWNLVDPDVGVQTRAFYATTLTETIINSSISFAGNLGTYGQARTVNGVWRPDILDCGPSDEGIDAVATYLDSELAHSLGFGLGGGFGDGGF